MTTKRPRAPKKIDDNIDDNVKDEIPLDENLALGIQLAQSRLNEAQLAVQLRQRELDSVVNTVKARYEENGKYVVTRIDFAKMVVERVETVRKVEAPTTN